MRCHAVFTLNWLVFRHSQRKCRMRIVNCRGGNEENRPCLTGRPPTLARIGMKNVHFFMSCSRDRRGKCPKDNLHSINKDMKISPEPLHPLRCWRELWQSESVTGVSSLRKHAPSAESALWKQPKRTTGLQWLTHLFIRNLDH